MLLDLLFHHHLSAKPVRHGTGFARPAKGRRRQGMPARRLRLRARREFDFLFLKT